MTTSQLSPDQQQALDKITEWFGRVGGQVEHCDGVDDDCPKFAHTHAEGLAPVMSLGGWAGTGKTTLVRQLEDVLGIKAVFGTPTHKAAGVLRKKLSEAQANRVRTYHSMIYHSQVVYHCTITTTAVRKLRDECVCGQDDDCECPPKFGRCEGVALAEHAECRIEDELIHERRKYLGGHRDLIVIDEASMLSEEQVEDVRSFGVPVLLVGDRGQLPPIKADMNPWISRPDVELTRFHRQGEGSGVLAAAHAVRIDGALKDVLYGIGDAVVIKRSHPEFTAMLERFVPDTERAIITHTNALRSFFNRAYHGDGPPRAGDRVVRLGQAGENVRVAWDGKQMGRSDGMVRTFNGMTGTIRKVIKVRKTVVELLVELDEHRLATPGNPVHVVVHAALAQFGAEQQLPPDKRPKRSSLWDYAYALTAHKAQGSEYDHVLVIDQRAPQYGQWMYTAITRAKKAVVVVDWFAK